MIIKVKELKMKAIGLRSQKEFIISFSLMVSLCFCLLFAGLSFASVPKVVQDGDITSHIEIELWAHKEIPANAIDVATDEGIVTLSGTVDNILAKILAQKIAEATVGVRAVINLINVVPLIPRTDEELERDVKDALLIDPATGSYKIDVNVHNGVVKLTGKVNSWQEKQLCTTVTEGVRGVIDVKNDIEIGQKTERTDFEIEQEVKQRLANDVLVDDALINVSVKNKVVFLTGTVGSLQEKNRAESDAWVSGVNSVDASGLEIEWWDRDDMRRTSLYVSRSDDEIKQAVKDSFIYDPRVHSFNINVNVGYGIVTLSGVVDNLEAKKAAENDAKDTMGVTRIINNLKVRPTVAPTNEELVESVKKAFREDPYIQRYDLNVSAYGGTVYLSGVVHTSWEKNRAGDIADGVLGVVAVVNNIDFEHKWVWKPDWQIKDDVKSQLFWDPFVDENQVNVSVENGIVTLTGVVNTYSERQSAEDNAYEGGAKEVINHLTVTHKNYGSRFYNPYSP
jgi:osmotically-inducible protein OsmY